MAQASEPILFVSMDGKGVKSSIIRAHAARKGHQKSRQNMANRSSSSPDQQTKSSADPVTKAKSRRKASGKPAQKPALLKAREESTNESTEDSEEQNSSQQLVPAKQKATPSPFQIWLPSCMSDRFVGMFFETMMPSYTAAYDAFNVPNIIRQEWPIYMGHEVFLWTEAAAIQGLYESLQNPSKPPSQKVLLYKAKALSCLKQELLKIKNGQLDDYLVMSIFVLASLDLMAGDEIAHDAHKKILRTAFATAGGLHNYGSFVRNTTMRLDSFWRSTASEPTTPAVPLLQPSRAPTIPTHPFAPDLCTLIGNLPIGFQELALQRKLPLDVLEVLGRIADPTQKPLPSLLKSADNRSPTTHCGMYLDFWESCPSLSSTSSTLNHTNSANTNEPPLERLLSLALLIYTTNRDSTNPLRMYNCITNGAIYDLTHDLALCEARRAPDEEHCLFWIWSVTVDAMRDRFGQLTAQGEGLLALQKRRFPDVIATGVDEAVLSRFWFASDSKSGSCLFEKTGAAVPVARLRRTSTWQTGTSRSEVATSTGSPDASGSGNGGWTESMDSWSIGTPPAVDGTEYVAGVGRGSSQADETGSVGSKWHGPGFGLLPSGKGKEAVELSYGRIDKGKQGPVRCMAG